eukprot:519512_1
MSTSFTVGDTVQLSNHGTGVIKFIGEMASKPGIHYGIDILDLTMHFWTHFCTNDGSLNKIRYFTTTKKDDQIHNRTGIFVKKKDIIKPISKQTALRVSVGDIVWIDKYKCNAIIRFIGPTNFGKTTGQVWYGVQLEASKGKNNGTIGGRKYFHCADRHGLFVKPTAIFSNYRVLKHLCNMKEYDSEQVKVAAILQKWLRLCCIDFSYDICNKYNFLLSSFITTLIKSFVLTHYDNISELKQYYFQLTDMGNNILNKIIRGIQYRYYNKEENKWCKIKLYLNKKQSCKNVETGCVGTWKIIKKQDRSYDKNVLCVKFNHENGVESETSFVKSQLVKADHELYGDQQEWVQCWHLYV